LEENGIVYLKNIGEIGLNEDNNLIFFPTDQNNYLSTSFGLSPFISPLVKREIFEKKIESIKTKQVS